MLTFVLVAVAVATAWPSLALPARAADLLRLAVGRWPSGSRPRRCRRHHGAHRPEPLGGRRFHLLVSLAMVVAGRAVPAPARPPAGTASRVAASGRVLRAGDVRRGLGGPLRRHRRDRVRSARRRREATRNGLDPLQVSQLHADLVFLLVGLTVGLWFALRATGACRRRPRAAALAGGRAAPGRRRLRAVLHRPADRRWSACTCSAPPSSSAARRPGCLITVREPTGTDAAPGAVDRGSATPSGDEACTPVDRPTVVPLRRSNPVRLPPPPDSSRYEASARRDQRSRGRARRRRRAATGRGSRRGTAPSA